MLDEGTLTVSDFEELKAAFVEMGKNIFKEIAAVDFRPTPPPPSSAGKGGDNYVPSGTHGAQGTPRDGGTEKRRRSGGLGGVASGGGASSGGFFREGFNGGERGEQKKDSEGFSWAKGKSHPWEEVMTYVSSDAAKE